MNIIEFSWAKSRHEEGKGYIKRIYDEHFFINRETETVSQIFTDLGYFTTYQRDWLNFQLEKQNG